MDSRYYRRWMDEEIRTIIKLRDDENKTWSEIAKELDTTPDAVRGQYRSAKRQDMDVEEQDGDFEDKSDGAIRTISSKSTRITSLDELISFFKVNLDEWQIERYIVNSWEVGAKNGNELVVHPLYQVKAWLFPKRLSQIELDIRPIEITIPKETQNRRREQRKLKVGVALFDPHFGFLRNFLEGTLEPFHDRKSLDLALQVCEILQPDLICVGGDILDLPDWTDKFLRSPEMYWATQPAAVEAAWWLSKFRKTTDEMKAIPGNHDDRIPKTIIKYAAAAHDLRPVDEPNMALMSLDRLLGLKSLNIEYIEGYKEKSAEIWINDFSCIHHGYVANSKSGQTVASEINDAGYTYNLIHGHIHRIEKATKKVRNGRFHRNISISCPGSLCRTDGLVPGSDKDSNWQNGFSVFYYDEEFFEENTVSIDGDRCLFQGELFTFRDQTGNINKDIEKSDWNYKFS